MTLREILTKELLTLINEYPGKFGNRAALVEDSLNEALCRAYAESFNAHSLKPFHKASIEYLILSFQQDRMDGLILFFQMGIKSPQVSPGLFMIFEGIFSPERYYEFDLGEMKVAPPSGLCAMFDIEDSLGNDAPKWAPDEYQKQFLSENHLDFERAVRLFLFLLRQPYSEHVGDYLIAKIFGNFPLDQQKEIIRQAFEKHLHSLSVADLKDIVKSMHDEEGAKKIDRLCEQLYRRKFCATWVEGDLFKPKKSSAERKHRKDIAMSGL